MVSYYGKIKNEFLERKQTYVRKMKWAVAVSIAAMVVIAALAITLSKQIPSLILVFGVIALATWASTHIGEIEKTGLINFIRDVLKKILGKLKEKEAVFQEMDDPADFSLLEILSSADKAEKEALGKFAGKSFENVTPKEFENIVRKKATNDVRALWERVKGVDKEHTLATYSDMLELVGKSLKEERQGRKDSDYETCLVEIAFKKMLEPMQEKDRRLLENEIEKYAKDHLGKRNLNISLATGGLITANLGGFATYTMASTLLAGVSSTLGIALPFAAYTTLSSALSVVIGPVGLIALGAWGLHKLTSPNIKTTTLIVLEVASIRGRLIYERPDIHELKKDIESYRQQKEDVETLLKRIDSTSMIRASFFPAIENDLQKQIEHSSKPDEPGENDRSEE
jgi:uncharacterized protein YaaW (UPF0174 family)